MFGGTSEEVSFRLCGSGILSRMPFGFQVCHFDLFQLQHSVLVFIVLQCYLCLYVLNNKDRFFAEGKLTMSAAFRDDDILIARLN